MRPRKDISDLDMFMAQPTRFQICFFVAEFSTLFFELGSSRWTLGGFGRVGEDFSDIFFSSHSLGVFLSLLVPWRARNHWTPKNLCLFLLQR